MNRLSLSALALGTVLLAIPAPQANAAGYCLIGEIDQCTFTSLAQCLEAANGVAGWCVVDGDTTSQSSGRSPRH